MLKRICFLTSSLLACSFGGGNIDERIEHCRGIVPVEDDGFVEDAFCWCWEMLTGHTLGMSLEDLANSENLPVEVVVAVLQNHVEGSVATSGVSRSQAIEHVLFMSGYDRKMDGKIKISSDDEIAAANKLKKARARKKAYLKRKKAKK